MHLPMHYLLIGLLSLFNDGKRVDRCFYQSILGNRNDIGKTLVPDFKYIRNFNWLDFILHISGNVNQVLDFRY